jgi:hypothetical protein
VQWQENWKTSKRTPQRKGWKITPRSQAIRTITERHLWQAEILTEEDRVAVNYENLEKFLAHLKNETTLPIIVTGIEDMGCFGWEEYYNLGPGSKSEYEKLRKKYPSFRDKYELLCFNENFDDEEGLYVEVLRIDDKKKFTLTLADLETVEKRSKNAQLLDDYAVWNTNFRI